MEVVVPMTSAPVTTAPTVTLPGPSTTARSVPAPRALPGRQPLSLPMMLTLVSSAPTRDLATASPESASASMDTRAWPARGLCVPPTATTVESALPRPPLLLPTETAPPTPPLGIPTSTSDASATSASVALTAPSRSALPDPMSFLDMETPRDATALDVESATTARVSASASLDTTETNASTRQSSDKFYFWESMVMVLGLLQFLRGDELVVLVVGDGDCRRFGRDLVLRRGCYWDVPRRCRSRLLFLEVILASC
mmetsp:Transcript_18009/g.37484  ORF Transcript_18009/g.37484 Transcript_18009/m.37484 type:complete len:255 (+) Transcript_18009:128-892(+)